jgi:competence protein ComEC
MEADGDGRPLKDARAAKAFQCDASSCVAMVKGKLVSHVHHPSALRDDCRRAAVLIAQFPIAEPCTQPEVVIDSLALQERGAHTMRVTQGGLVLETANAERGRRPWAPGHRRKEKIQAVAPSEPFTDRGKAGGAPPPETGEGDAQ